MPERPNCLLDWLHFAWLYAHACWFFYFSIRSEVVDTSNQRPKREEWSPRTHAWGTMDGTVGRLLRLNGLHI